MVWLGENYWAFSISHWWFSCLKIMYEYNQEHVIIFRYDLLLRLIAETDLATKPNNHNENILLFLVQTVGRQMVEQRQYRPSKSKKIISRKSSLPVSNSTDGSVPEMPDHDLEPPRFCRRALERLLNDWPAVNSMLNTGAKTAEAGGAGGKGSALYEDQAFLASQSGTALLDKFTNYLVVKCSAEMLDTLLSTLIRQLQTCSEENKAGLCIFFFLY